MRKALTALILVPLGIVIVMFAVANREIVTVTFDPFDTAQPAFALPLPLFIMRLFGWQMIRPTVYHPQYLALIYNGQKN
jgi:hypothetical protein